MSRQDIAPSREPSLGKTVPSRLAPSRLTVAPERLVGRDDELGRLEEAWGASETHVVSIVAWGGAGKTSVVAKWAGELATRGYDGASYFDWSFFSQGTREQAGASSDSFIAAALEFFGAAELARSPAPGWDKGTKLAELVAARRTLLILDGLEPLQYPPGPLGGQLKDPAMKALLRGLAAKNAGLCLVTTRAPLADLAAFRDREAPLRGTAPEWKLDRLATAAGVELLEGVGVQGARADLERLANDVRGHALTLNLLGRYLRDAHGGDVRRRDRVRLAEADAEEQAGHAFRVLEVYERWISDRVQLAVLRLMCLFDRPANGGCLAALRKEPAIAGLTDSLVDLPEEKWNLAVARLREYGLIEDDRRAGGLQSPGASPRPPNTRGLTPTDSPSEVELDAHPLVREYFAGRLRTEQPEAWQVAHERVFEFLCGSVEDQPNTLDRLQYLYQAVVHGCLAGRQQDAFDNVYRRRIQRGGDFYSLDKLGAFGSELGAIASFLEPTSWRRVSSRLNETSQAFLLNEAAFTLRGLGRLSDAVEPMAAGLEMVVAHEDWKEAAEHANNLSELTLALGSVSDSVEIAEQSVVYADRSNDEFQRIVRRTTLADVLHQSGRRSDALVRFREAESLQATGQPTFPQLHSQAGFQYCDLVLADAERAAWQATLTTKSQISNLQLQAACRDAQQRATIALSLAKERKHLLHIAFHYLTLSRARLYRALLDRVPISNLKGQIQADAAAAVDGLRRAGHQDELPKALLTRAWLRSICGDVAAAQADLDEAWEIAARGPMPLFLADIHLYRARLFGRKRKRGWGFLTETVRKVFRIKDSRPLVRYPWQSQQDDLAEAHRLIEKHGYHRRDQELAECGELF